MARIVIIAGYAASLIRFRGDLIKQWINDGHEVIAMAPEPDFADKIKILGATYFAIPMRRTGLNPFSDLYTLFVLTKSLMQIKPDIVFSYTIKPVIYGSVAAKIAGVQAIYSMITGLGYAFIGDTIKRKLLMSIVSLFYKRALRYNKKIFFQNPDDVKLFHEEGIMPDSVKVVLINGSGVDIDQFAFTQPPIQVISFLLIARLLWDKGIGEFVEAARLLKKRYPNVYFKLLGPFDSNPDSISYDDVRQWQQEELIEYLGETNDVRPYIADCSVYVLPSSYREGTPRSILEALSSGRPVITTDAPGCRETVIERVNGFLVPLKDSNALAQAMERFIVDVNLIPTMGAKSREIAVHKYDVHKVNLSIMQAMGLMK